MYIRVTGKALEKNRILAINRHVCGHLIFNKNIKTILWGKENVSNKCYWKTGHPFQVRKQANLYPLSHADIVAELCLTLLQPYGLEPARLLCPWDFQGKDAGVGCHFLLPGIFRT